MLTESLGIIPCYIPSGQGLLNLGGFEKLPRAETWRSRWRIANMIGYQVSKHSLYSDGAVLERISYLTQKILSTTTCDLYDSYDRDSVSRLPET